MKSKIIASFRDPSGFVFKQDGKVFRQINEIYKNNYELLMTSGLYEKTTKQNLLVPHQETHLKGESGYYKIIEPLQIPFISYPYEWCFSQLKDAALLTLKIEKIALEFGQTLKDATSFNIQFLNGRPILIDTLSFEKYEQGEPWIAYKQFCEQFLAPLALYALVDPALNGLLQSNMGSIPLNLTARLLPVRANLNLTILLHIILHARSQKKYAGKSIRQKPLQNYTKQSLLALIDNLESGINSLALKAEKSKWNEYYLNNNYQEKSFQEKEKLVANFLKETQSKHLWDIGANSGNFSRIAAKMGISVISMDNDLAVVEQNYLQTKKDKETKILPLYQDIANPTPCLGWENKERDSFLSRPHPDTILALALIHHLAIGNNLPFGYIANLFSKLCINLIIEFVPKEDSQVQILLQQRLDIFTDYNEQEFEKEFKIFFIIKKKTIITGTKRTLYLMQKK